jgi:putative serine/threonine protein kinase
VKTGQQTPLTELTDTKHCQVICYPKCEPQELKKRLTELKNLGVKTLEFTGQRTVFGIPVLGKGYVGVVVAANTTTGRAALKIRRIDSDRENMFHEAEMIKKANSIGVGPKLLAVSKNFLLMQLIEGQHFPEWQKSLQTKEEWLRVRPVIRQVLEQCYRLDKLGLDHGELSKAPKHIIVDEHDVPFLLDFETSSINRRVSNVTSVCQYLFLGTYISDAVQEKVKRVDKKVLIKELQAYKQELSRDNFEAIVASVT